ncbi:hypothetical protein GGR42_000438 [Saonia flava]|uniref:SbsA Ig-like domain-containing protein n=1 Tax=Saonia flava TaxID=523696 RepID=A0A846QLY6_9FLAO|nr:Ig-like domain-containing protein [Saonia flava]NJB69976.1 hypothetical protein [Saonia flava]
MLKYRLQIFNIGIKTFLIPFLLLGVYKCKNVQETIDIDVNYEDEKAVSITFESTIELENLKVFTYGNNDTPVLANFLSKGHMYTYKPIVPFSAGQHYVLKQNGMVLGRFAIKGLGNRKKTELLSIYPSKDTLPENLLKMYFVFSQPMQEVKSSLEYITIKNLETGKEESIFLNLEPELWNMEHTELTLWLDPGRIKTDLIPNKEKGLPIVQGSFYEIIIESDWKDSNGNDLKQQYAKEFFVTGRDVLRPVLKNWKIHTPKRNTKNPLRIQFNEPLDAFLAKETIRFRNPEHEILNGDYVLLNGEEVLEFYPNTNWKEGKYEIRVDSKLEDLAGNNMNNLFDVDLEEKSVHGSSKPTHTLVFKIQ